MTGTPRIFALIVAAGTGSRAGGVVPKQYRAIAGKPLLAYSCEAFLREPQVAGVQVVIHPEHADSYRAATEGLGQAVGLANPLPIRGRAGVGPNVALTSPNNGPHLTSPLKGEGHDAAPLASKLLPPVHGGAERHDSVLAGLNALLPHRPDYVLIHDAARPFLGHEMLRQLIAALSPEQAVLPALPVADTIRRLEAGAWLEVPRDGLLRMQTPQCFPYAALKEVVSRQSSVVSKKEQARGMDSSLMTHDSRLTTSYTDEAAIWLAAGGSLSYVAGDEDLRKVTTAADIAWAENHASLTRGAHRVAVGMGFDVHALMPSGEKGVIRLGGIDIQHSHTLHGHSDADVVLHAVVDALLGSIAAGDIGSHFPPSDARWKGADSRIFIEEARRQVAARGGVIQHLDITIIGEQPKVSPHRDAMRAAIADMLKLPLSHVSIKATTTEKLGFTGREEGIACNAVATVSLPMEGA